MTKGIPRANSAGMNYVIFLLFTFITPLVFGAQSISGYLVRSGHEYSLRPQNSDNRYTIIANDPDVLAILTRLEGRDFIAGRGSLDTINKKLYLVGIDYVGLRKILGRWVGSDGLLNFKDFTIMKFSPRFSDSNQDKTPDIYQKEFRYSMSPGDGDEWALFLSDNKSTTFATVKFEKQKIKMKIYESESGRILRTLKLERL